MLHLFCITLSLCLYLNLHHAAVLPVAFSVFLLSVTLPQSGCGQNNIKPLNSLFLNCLL